MNIFLAGEGTYAEQVHARLLRTPGVTIVGVATPDAERDPFALACGPGDYTTNIPLSSLRHVKITRALFDYLRVDLLVLANVPILLPPPVIDHPPHGSLCFHPSLLPRHRGKDAVRAAIAAGDTMSGVTIFRPDAGADTGPIVEQVACPVPVGVSAGRLYYGTLVPLGVDAMIDAIKAVRDGRARYAPQPCPALSEAAS